jgi:hypothetical protein
MLLSDSWIFLTEAYFLGICLDLDWLDDELFASCSADKVIHVLSVNRAEPVAILTWGTRVHELCYTDANGSIGDTMERSTRLRRIHWEHASCHARMT